MPGLGPTTPFRDPNELKLCQLLSENYETIRQEYDALVEDMESGSGKDRFQSVTSMNYEGGWRTLVLFYNGHRIPKFPYHLCPTTTKIMETVPLAGRIAGFNRQQPQTGIPLHTDGNNMWLTCQMGVYVPEGEKAYIRVGPETRRWKKGECLVYDTTYEHETMNEHPTQERVVLHVDLFNTLTMTAAEIEVMEYIYQLREQFMKAEGVAKVGAQIL
jgi:aspartyl/asparaginyl beta-hydroxylase (cupin superfamily)